MSTAYITVHPQISSIGDMVIPLEFEVADSPAIEIGTVVRGRFGIGCVRTIKRVNGEVGCSVTRLYRTRDGQFVEPVNASHFWAWQSEIEAL